MQALQSQQTAQQLEAKVALQASNDANKVNVTEDQLFPPNAQLGHCYSRVLTPATFKTVTDRTLVKPESEKIEIVADYLQR
ncbi:hypothetical protein ACLKMH_04210 [Psychromonas sp. KJ10-10]|uniref:hypothetical protein n=1 Tax=Psychromonas sp. KJ10-10 TaxID=3391823 RepID=UPI0039B5B908